MLICGPPSVTWQFSPDLFNQIRQGHARQHLPAGPNGDAHQIRALAFDIRQNQALEKAQEQVVLGSCTALE